jgi:hypothetical protein
MDGAHSYSLAKLMIPEVTRDDTVTGMTVMQICHACNQPRPNMPQMFSTSIQVDSSWTRTKMRRLESRSQVMRPDEFLFPDSAIEV